MDNYKKAYANNALYQIGYMLFTGSIMQGFLLNSGVESTAVYTFESTVTTVAFVVLLVSVFFSDKIKKVKTVMAVIPLFIIPVFVVMAVASFSGIGNKVFIPLLFFAALAYVFVGLHNTASYKLPYEIIDINNYGRYTGVSGIVSGVATFAISLLYSYIISKGDFFTVHGSFALFAIVCLLFASYFVSSCKQIEQKEEPEKKGKFNVEIFKSPQMWILLLPNVLRGISAGIINLIAVVAVTSKIIDVESVSVTVIAAQLALFAANMLFVKSLEKFNVQTVMVTSGIIMCTLLPFAVKVRGLVSFVVIYFVIRLFMVMVDSSIPVCVTKIVPYRQIGAFTSIRMMAMTCGTALAPVILGFLEKRTGYFVIFAIAAAMKLVCCFAYGFLTQKAQKEKEVMV